MLVPCRIENKDVGFVRAGQEVEVKIESFNFTRYGLVHGTVLGLTRDAVIEPQSQAQSQNKPGLETQSDSRPPPGASTYTARITLDRAQMDTENGVVPLGPGMTVTTEIRTGKRKVMEFLLSPIQTYRREGLRER